MMMMMMMMATVLCRRLNIVSQELNVSVNWLQIQELANEGIQIARELLASEIVQHPAHSFLRADLHYIEGTCLCKLRQFAEAENAFLNALKNDKDYLPALLGVAEASHAREIWFQALCYYTNFIDRSVDYYKSVTTIDRSISL
jgi:tetratricopeptide (TPR) repeat protein